MSTTPLFGSAPGFRSVALRIAVPSLLFSMESAPALNVLLGLAVLAEKSAPEPTAVAIARSPSARVARVRLRLFLSGGAAEPADGWAPARAPGRVAVPAEPGPAVARVAPAPVVARVAASSQLSGPAADASPARRAVANAPGASLAPRRAAAGASPNAPAAVAGPPAIPCRKLPRSAAPSLPSRRPRNFILLPTAHLPGRPFRPARKVKQI